MEKYFKVEKNDKNLKWVNDHLDPRDFYTMENEIVIGYYSEMQRNDILNAMMLNLLNN